MTNPDAPDMVERGLLGALATIVVLEPISAFSSHHPDEWHEDTQSRIIAGLSMPQGSVVDRAEGIEIWYSPDTVAASVERMQQQLPIDQPLDGVPWCETSSNEKLQLTTWSWANSTQYISVAVNDFHPGKSWKGSWSYGSEVSFTVRSPTRGAR